MYYSLKMIILFYLRSSKKRGQKRKATDFKSEAKEEIEKTKLRLNRVELELREYRKATYGWSKKPAKPQIQVRAYSHQAKVIAKAKKDQSDTYRRKIYFLFLYICPSPSLSLSLLFARHLFLGSYLGLYPASHPAIYAVIYLLS